MSKTLTDVNKFCKWNAEKMWHQHLYIWRCLPHLPVVATLPVYLGKFEKFHFSCCLSVWLSDCPSQYWLQLVTTRAWTQKLLMVTGDANKPNLTIICSWWNSLIVINIKTTNFRIQLNINSRANCWQTNSKAEVKLRSTIDTCKASCLPMTSSRTCSGDVTHVQPQWRHQLHTLLYVVHLETYTHAQTRTYMQAATKPRSCVNSDVRVLERWWCINHISRHVAVNSACAREDGFYWARFSVFVSTA